VLLTGVKTPTNTWQMATTTTTTVRLDRHVIYCPEKPEKHET
tara:strand:+ start:292 stop:417 length:126 start_codon:yes stop_codon:yes gene_type:complete